MKRIFDAEMSAYCSMKTGGVAEEAYFPESREELIGTAEKLIRDGRRFHVLGKMSNVLLPDGVLPFVPIVTTSLNEMRVTEYDTFAEVYADCGVSYTPFAMEMCRKGYDGLTFAYGIPGTLGGAVFMNAGAYGGETKDVVTSVDFYDFDRRETRRIDAADCAFGYRHSVFAELNGIILGATMRLIKGDAETLVGSAKELMCRRAEKQPLEYPSCGSAFKRPEGYFAGKLIEDSGLRGFALGGAAVSEKHCGFIINRGGATTADVTALIDAVQKKVKADSGVTLEPEIRVLQ